MQSIQGLQAKQALTDAGFDAKQADLMARIPGLAQTALDHLNSQASTDAFRADSLRLSGDRLKESIAHDKALEKRADASAKALAAYRAGQLTLGEYNAETSRIRATYDTQPRFDASRSRALGYRVDQYGNQIGDTREVLPGFRFNAAGDVVKAPSSSALKRPGGMTQSQWTTVYGKVNKQADDFYHGVGELKDSRGQVIRPAQAGVLYPDAFARIKETHPTMANKRIYAILNLYYQPGEGGRPPLPARAPVGPQGPAVATLVPPGIGGSPVG